MTTRQQIDRIKDILNIAEDKELAELLNINPKVVGQWAIRKNISKDGWMSLKKLGITKDSIFEKLQNTTDPTQKTLRKSTKTG